MNHDPFEWGRPSDATYGTYNHAIANASISKVSKDVSEFPTMNTQQPIITGSSVISIKFKDGVIIAADNLGSYGSLSRFTDVERIIAVGKNTVVGISGDISDLQQLERILENLETDINYDYDGHSLRAPHVHEYLQKVFYNRRNKMNPLWNSVIVAGLDDDNKPFTKYVDLLGVTYSSPTIGTGFGAHLAIPLLRKVVFKEEDVPNTDEETARKAIQDSMKILNYRDARSVDKYTMVTITKEKGVVFEKNLRAQDASWRFAKDIRGYGAPQA